MIAIFMDTKEDTNTFAPLFNNIDCTLLTNPTKEEVREVLTANPTETLMCLGHGSPMGLFGADWEGFVLDSTMVPLLKDREMIGIWCYASDFARKHNLKGFFTYMFISNVLEARCHGRGQGVTDEMVYEENMKFSNSINELITNKTPLTEWVETLYENCNHELSFVEYNYSNLSYFDGENNFCPKYLLEEETEDIYEPTLFDYMFDNNPSPMFCFVKRDSLMDYLCEKNGGEWNEDIDSLTDDEFITLSTYQYSVEEYVYAYNEGVVPNEKEFYIRYIK
jgi:hypothetical protein